LAIEVKNSAKVTQLSFNHGRWKDFFPGEGTRGFSKIFLGGSQKWWNLFFPLETKKQPFLLIFSKSRGPSDAHGFNTIDVFLHDVIVLQNYVREAG